MSGVPITYPERITMPAGPLMRPGGAPAAAFSINDILAVVKGRLFLILFVWFFFIGATVGGTFVWARYYPTYDAVAYVKVDAPTAAIPFTLEQQQGNLTQETVQRMVSDQAMLATRDDVLQEVLKDAAVMATDWYKAFPEAEKPFMLRELKDQLSVRPEQGTSYLSIRMGTRSIKDPHVIVNTVMQKYLFSVNEQARTRVSEQLQQYRDEARALERLRDELSNRKRIFVEQTLTTPGAIRGQNSVGDALSRVTQEVALLEAEQSRYRSLYEALASSAAQQIVLSPEMQLMIETDPRVANYNNQLANLEAGRFSALSTFGPNHPVTREIEAQIASVREQLDREITLKQEQVRSFERSQAEMNYLSATQALLQLRERKVELESQQRDLDRQLAEYLQIEEQLEQAKIDLSQVENYLRMLDMIQRQRNAVQVYPVQSAIPPIERSAPRWSLNVPLGTVFGLALALGLALLLEFADTTVRTPRDIARHVRLPILGTVPDVDDEEIAIEQVELASLTSPRSMIAEAFRHIRTNLLLSAPAERQRTVLVTSPKPEDGKTTVAVNLAISIAQSGRRVLLVDANLRRPTLHRIFSNGAGRGLCHALIGQARLEDLIHKTSLPNLDVVFAGPTPPNPAELLGGSYMREFLAQASDRYDQIIFDGPPVLLVSDALVVGGLLDGVVLVCRAKVDSRGVVQRARDQLERIQAHLFGAVLNAAQARRGGYFREQLRTYYDYQPEELPAEEAAAALPGEAGGGPPADKT